RYLGESAFCPFFSVRRRDDATEPNTEWRGAMAPTGIHKDVDGKKDLRIDRSILDALPDCWILLDEDGVVSHCNKRALQLFGQTEIRGKPLAEVIVSDSRDLFEKVRRSSVEFHKPYSMDIEIQLYPDKRIEGEVYLSPLLDEEDKRGYVSVILKDMTERKKTELQLLRFANAIHYTVNPIQITDSNGRMIYVNPAFERTSGYSKEELIGSDPKILSSGKHPPEFWRSAWEVISAGKVWRDEVVNRNKSGELIYADLTISPIVGPSGTVVGFLGTHRDLTEQKKLEKELQTSEQYLATILRNSGDAIVGIDLQNRVVSWNLGAEAMFGYGEQEIVGKSFEVLVPPDLLSKGELQELASEVYKRGVVRNYETERVTKNGQRNVVSITSSVIRDERGNIIGRSAILRDITAMKMLLRQMNHAEKLTVIGQLAAGLAHEVGNPLTSISSLVQVIQRTTHDQFANEKLELVKNQINRIAKILRDLVDFARPSVHELQNVNINEIVREAVNMVRYGKRAKQILFEISADESLPSVRVVPDQLHQVMVNLLINAVDSIGRKSGTIAVRTKTVENTVSIEVSDTGKGIDKEGMSKLFDPFYTTKPVGEGTGLGLWVSLGIIRSFRGDISVSSQINKGTTFTISLPMT
ncbi:MAG TPA: PAS domain S-box protein, partial [Bacteroidota bacterium]